MFMNMSRWRIIYLCGITLAGIYLRIMWILKIPSMAVYDFATYQATAASIFNHAGAYYQGKPIAFQGIGYQALLGYFYRLAGSSDAINAKILNVILSCLTLIAFYFVLAKLTNNRGIITISYTILALLPNYIAYNNVIGTEVFFTFIFMLVVLLQLYHFDDRFRLPLIGILIGIGALTRPLFLAYPAVVALCMWLRNKNIKASIVSFLVTFLVMSVVIAPWTYRNYRKYHQFIPVSYNSGYVLYINNNSANVHGMWMALNDVPAPPEIKGQINAILRENQGDVKLAYGLNNLLTREALQWIKSHPGKFLKLGFIRLKQVYFSGAPDVESWAMNGPLPQMTVKEKYVYERNVNLFMSFCDIAVDVLSSLGLVFVLLSLKNVIPAFFQKDVRVSDLVIFPTVNIIFFSAVYFVFEGQSRYNFPVLFLLAICAGVCLKMVKDGLAGSDPAARGMEH